MDRHAPTRASSIPGRGRPAAVIASAVFNVPSAPARDDAEAIEGDGNQRIPGDGLVRPDGSRDVHARARVLVRVERLAAGNPGDVRPVSEVISELRIDYGPGYRVYFKKQGRPVVVPLAGGDKRTQSRDIETALRLARGL